MDFQKSQLVRVTSHCFLKIGRYLYIYLCMCRHIAIYIYTDCYTSFMVVEC